jgi:hypothetical protein
MKNFKRGHKVQMKVFGLNGITHETLTVTNNAPGSRIPGYVAVRDSEGRRFLASVERLSQGAQ